MRRMPTVSHELAEDLLQGASQIAEFIFGDPRERRRVYHLATLGKLPCFRLGGRLCARKSTLNQFIASSERGGSHH